MPKGVYIRTARSEIAKKHVSEGRLLMYANGYINPCKGRKSSIETRRRISLSNTGKLRSVESRLRMSVDLKKRWASGWNPLLNYVHSSATKEKIRASHLGKPCSLETRAKISASLKGKFTGEKNPNYGNGDKLRETWKKNRDRWVLAIQTKPWKHPIRPNKSELRLSNILNKSCPNEYRYTGDGSFIVGGLNPDFLNVNGKKKVIELFGDYWHSPEKVGTRGRGTEQGKKSTYKEFGFDCLVIWERDLFSKPEEEIIKNVQDFNR